MLTGIAFLLAAASPAPAIPMPMGTPDSCNRAVTVQTPVIPDYPTAARSAHLGEVRAVIDVLVNADGKVVSERVVQSTTNLALDQSALTAARESTYLPKLVNCKPVQSTYRFLVTFDPAV